MIPVGSLRTACRYRLPSSLLLLDGREKDVEGDDGLKGQRKILIKGRMKRELEGR